MHSGRNSPTNDKTAQEDEKYRVDTEGLKSRNLNIICSVATPFHVTSTTCTVNNINRLKCIIKRRIIHSTRVGQLIIKSVLVQEVRLTPYQPGAIVRLAIRAASVRHDVRPNLKWMLQFLLILWFLRKG